MSRSGGSEEIDSPRAQPEAGALRRSGSAGGPGPIAWRVLAAPACVALIVRLWNIRAQIIGDDELHAVNTALAMPLSRILVTFHDSDPSIPITAFLRVWIQLGGQLTELGLRTPVIVASLALVVLGPRLLAPIGGVSLARLWAWMLALSPLLVIYGRIVRSYAFILLLATCAVLALLRYLRGDSRRFAALFAIGGAGAVWFHPAAGPFVAASLLSAGAATLLPPGGRTGRRGLLALVGAGTALALLAGALLVPTADSLRLLVASKTGSQPVSLSTLADVALLFSGVRSAPVAVALWAIAAFGSVALWRSERRDLALIAPVALLVQAVALVLLAPNLSSPLYTARAFLVCLPLLLLAGAAGVERLFELSGLEGARRRAGLVALGLAVAALGPFAEPVFWRTPFRQHDDYIVFTSSRPRLADADVPAFYRELDVLPPGAIVELPWHPFWGFGHAIPAYQELHGREVFVANLGDLANRPELRWSHYVSARPQSLLATPARFAVVHADFEEEERIARVARGEPDRVRPHPRHWATLRLEARRLRTRLDAAWGPPDIDDGRVAAWDLARVRTDLARRVNRTR